MLEESKLILNDFYPVVYTYMHGKGKSVIDYIISSNTNFVNKICVNKDASSNTSPHNAVSAEMTHIPTSKVNISCPKVNVKKVKWIVRNTRHS